MTGPGFKKGNSRAGKITPAEVFEMREAYAAGDSQGTLARRFQLSVGQVGRIVRGESWQQYSHEPSEGRYRNQAGGSLPTAEELEESTRRLESLLKGDENE